MNSELTHERCSELLADYLAGDLDPEQHRLVEDHLEDCAQCSAERAGLSALLSGEGEGLTGDERVELRAAVLGSTLSEEPAGRGLDDESDAVVVPLGARGARASKYLGVAALLAIVAVGSLFIFRGGGSGLTGSDDETGGDASTANLAEDSGEAGGDDAAEDAGADQASKARRVAEIRPKFQSDRGEISEDDLARLGRRNVILANSDAAQAYATAPESEENLLSDAAPEDQLERLAARVPEELASDITECGRTALDELDEEGHATYATTATLDDTDVVVLRFVTGDPTPERYAVFAFPVGDCTNILTSTEGPLD
jgi:Putative zinc-finger